MRKVIIWGIMLKLELWETQQTTISQLLVQNLFKSLSGRG